MRDASRRVARVSSRLRQRGGAVDGVTYPSQIPIRVTFGGRRRRGGLWRTAASSQRSAEPSKSPLIRDGYPSGSSRRSFATVRRAAGSSSSPPALPPCPGGDFFPRPRARGGGRRRLAGAAGSPCAAARGRAPSHDRGSAGPARLQAKRCKQAGFRCKRGGRRTGVKPRNTAAGDGGAVRACEATHLAMLPKYLDAEGDVAGGGAGRVVGAGTRDDQGGDGRFALGAAERVLGRRGQ